MSSAFEIGSKSIAAGSRATVDLEVSTLANNTQMHLPVHVVHGANPGPVIFVSGVIHGDEIQGVEIIRRVLGYIKEDKLAGTLLAVPIVNSFGFLTQSRYLPDRRDLNRSFPGSDRGSLASLLADLFFREVVKRCEYGVDFHTAALHRSNLPQIRVSPRNAELEKLAEIFAPPVILVAKERDGSLRKAAGEEGVQVLLYEGGEALRFDENAIDSAVKGTLRVMHHLGMVTEAPMVGPHHTIHKSSASSWVRAPEGGILHSVRQSGDRVAKLEPIGVISDPLGQESVSVVAEDDGIIIGRTHMPVVNRGDALFHIARLDVGAKGPVGTTPDEDEII
jgi:uncharacterized protein